MWAGSEGIWVGVFSLVAVVMITVMGMAMLRTTQIQEKWKGKLSKAMDNENQKGLGNASRRYAMFILPLITVLREGLEAIVFIGGVSTFFRVWLLLEGNDICSCMSLSSPTCSISFFRDGTPVVHCLTPASFPLPFGLHLLLSHR